MGKNKRTKNNRPPLARQADKYALYQEAVQVPEADVRFFDRSYRSAYGREPRVLREDFCGTAAVCCQWVKSKKNRSAFGVDLDPEPLSWGVEHNLSRLPPNARQRVRLLQQDVRDGNSPPADVIAAQNFSFFVFRTRAELLGYFRSAHKHLGRRGTLVLDLMGGPQVMEEDRVEKRRLDHVRYLWEQHRFDPISHQCRFYIHFKFEDGSRLDRAFSYDWRLWSIPEVRELLQEAGFKRSEVYWEGTDSKTGEGNGVYTMRERAPSDPAWIAYVVGIK